MQNSLVKSPGGYDDTDETWAGRYDRFSPDQSIFYRTNVSQGWKNFGEPLPSSQKKMFNNMKSGMGSSLSGKAAETNMMRAVCENKEIMDEYNQMQARIKKLNSDRSEAMRRIS